MFYSVDKSEDLSQGHSISDNCEKLFQRGKGGGEGTRIYRSFWQQKTRKSGTFLAVHWLGLCTTTAGKRELRSHMPGGTAKKIKNKKTRNSEHQKITVNTRKPDISN